MAADLSALVGKRVRARRLGWDEALSAADEFDLEPYGDKGHAADELRGVLEVVSTDSPETGPLTLYLVGGQEADPGTVEPDE